MAVVAYVSSGLPLLYLSSDVVSHEVGLVSDLFAIIGFLIVTLAGI